MRGARVRPTRPLQFKQPPNYEQPTDQDDNNDYEVTVAVSDGSASTTIAVTVTVANANDPGVITLSTTTPRANQSLTATLSDEDGVTGTVDWNDGYWSPSNTEERGKSDAKAANGTPNLTHTFAMTPDKVGWRFQAYAHYTDKFGSDSAQSAPTDPIGEDNRPPCSPTAFEATGSDEQVALSWSAPTGTNCAPLTHYAYRYKETSGGSWSETKDVGTATSATEKDVTNDITYTFELWAANDYGESAAVSAEVTPEPCTNQPPTLIGPETPDDFAENGTGAVGSYAADDNSSPRRQSGFSYSIAEHTKQP